MKHFSRDMLPDPISYFESEGLVLRGPGRWKTTRCDFHGGSDSLRVNGDSGAFKCMACGVHGADVLAYHMQRHHLDFLDAAESLGATLDDRRHKRHAIRRTLSPSAALSLIQSEVWLMTCAALSAVGFLTDDRDRSRLIEACRAVQYVMREATE